MLGQASFPPPLPTPLAACSVLLACVQYVRHDRTAGRLRATARGCPIVVKATTARSAGLHSAFSLSGETMPCCNRQLCPLYATQKSREVRRTTTRHDSTALDLASPRRLPTPRSSTPAPTLSPLPISTIPGVCLLIAVLLLPVDFSSCFRILVPNLDIRHYGPPR